MSDRFVAALCLATFICDLLTCNWVPQRQLWQLVTATRAIIIIIIIIIINSFIKRQTAVVSYSMVNIALSIKLC